MVTTTIKKERRGVGVAATSNKQEVTKNAVKCKTLSGTAAIHSGICVDGIKARSAKTGVVAVKMIAGTRRIFMRLSVVFICSGLLGAASAVNFNWVMSRMQRDEFTELRNKIYSKQMAKTPTSRLKEISFICRP